jgi:hypothetical protein
MPSNQKLSRGIQSMYQESCHGRQTPLDSSDRTSSSVHSKIFLSHTRTRWMLFVNPNQDSINSSGAALEVGT